jgi:hypothetical protein
MDLIMVPRTPKSAFNKNRALTHKGLLWHQLRHFRAVEQKLPAAQRSGIDIDAIRTEGEAAEYIRHLTSKLHPKRGKQFAKKRHSEKKRRIPRVKVKKTLAIGSGRKSRRKRDKPKRKKRKES